MSNPTTNNVLGTQKDADTRPHYGPPPWLGGCSSNMHGIVVCGSGVDSSHTVHHSDVEKPICPGSVFLDEVMKHPSAVPFPIVTDDLDQSNDSAIDANMKLCLSSDSLRQFSVSTSSHSEKSGAVSLASQPRKTRHYDDEDFRSHRHLVYPHMHQPMKVPEPRTLRRLRERASVVRVAGTPSKTTRAVTCHNNENNADNAEDAGARAKLSSKDADVASIVRGADGGKPSAMSQSTDGALFGGSQQVDIPVVISTEVSADDVGLTFRVDCSNPNELDPASPSLADRACILGQALKSREFEVDSWSLLRSADPVSDGLDRTDTESRGGPSGLASGPGFTVCSSSSDRLGLAGHEDESLKRKPIKFRRRRSRSKPFGRIFQPSLSKLSEEGSPASSSAASSSTVSIDANEPADVLHLSPHSAQSHPLNKRFSDELCLSANSLVDCNSGRVARVSGHQQQLAGDVGSKQQTSVTSNFKSASVWFEDEPVGNETCPSSVPSILEAKTCSTAWLPDYAIDSVLDELQQGCHCPSTSENATTTITNVSLICAPEQLTSPIFSKCHKQSQSGESCGTELTVSDHLLSVECPSAFSDTYLVDGDSGVFSENIAPLVRPESAFSHYDEFVAKGDDVAPVTESRACPLSVRTLAGVELGQLDHLKLRAKRTQLTYAVFSGEDKANKAGDAIKANSNRLSELLGSRQHPGISYSAFRASHSHWESRGLGPSSSLRSHRPLSDANISLRSTRKHCETSDHINGELDNSVDVLSTDPAVLHVTNEEINRAQTVDRSSVSGMTPRLDSDVDVFAARSVLEPRLLRADGRLLDYLPPVITELDVLVCRSDPLMLKLTPESVLTRDDGLISNFQWLEAARWIRYEEDLDPNVGRFGRAHCSALTFPAVVEYRRCLEQGAIVFRCDSASPNQARCSNHTDRHLCRDHTVLFAELEVGLSELSVQCGASEADIALLRHILHLRHQHTYELNNQPLIRTSELKSTLHADPVSSNVSCRRLITCRSAKEHGTRTSTAPELKRMVNDGVHRKDIILPLMSSPETCQDSVMPSVSNLLDQAPSYISLSQRAVYLLRRVLLRARLFPRSHSSGPSAVDSGSKSLRRDSPHVGCHVMDSLSGAQNVNFDATAGADHRSHLHGRLKSTTEVVSIQVGVLPGLHKPLFVFVRLHRPLYASTLTGLKESSPVRFFLIFLGPKQRRLDYFEVGRVFAIMMVDKDFRKNAYNATCREHLLRGLRNFLDSTVVLPLMKDVTLHSLRAMHDQFRLFRRHRRLRATSAHIHQLTDSMKMNVYELSNKSPKDPLRQSQTSIGDRVVQVAAATRRRWPGWPHDRQCASNRRVNGSAGLTCSLPLLTDYTVDGSPPASSYAPAERQCEQRRHRENVIRYAFRTSAADGSDGRDSNADRLADGLLPDHNCYRCLFGLAFYTDLVAYRNRFYSDLTEPFGRQGSELGVIFSTIILVYFIVLAPTLSFGALLSSIVSPDFSIPLCIFASGVAQCLFSLVGGQPLLIVGITGPMLILEICIKLVCDANQSFLPFMRLLTALYTSMFGLLAVLANAGWLVLRVRRSVNEIFNCFVSFYFILKALRSLFEGLAVTPVKSLHSTINNLTSRTGNVTNVTTDDAAKNLANPRSSISVVDSGLHHARMIATLLLAILTFTVCLWLQAIKRRRYCRRSVRILLGYFNIPIGLACAVLVNRVLFPHIRVPVIKMPTRGNGSVLSVIISFPTHLSTSSLAGTANKFTSFLFHPRSHGLAAFMALCLVPAIATGTMLSGIVVAKSDRRLRKPCLFSLDLAVCLCILPVICALLGWPFLSPAAIRSNAHTIALTKWNMHTPPGIPHRIVGCVEQRLTGLGIGVLVASSVLIEAQLFARIPVGALHGMFLFMGTMGLRDLVLVRRVCALLKRCKHWKDHEYVCNFSSSTIAGFVVIQLGFTMLLLALNLLTELAQIGTTSLVFPYILLTFAVLREQALPRCALFGPFLEQMDRLHQLQLPRLKCLRACQHNRTLVCRSEYHSDVHSSHSGAQCQSGCKYEPTDLAGTTHRLFVTSHGGGSNLSHELTGEGGILFVKYDSNKGSGSGSWMKPDRKLGELFRSQSDPTGLDDLTPESARPQSLMCFNDNDCLLEHTHSSSSASLCYLSGVDGYSDSEVEMRLDNPYCLD